MRAFLLFVTTLLVLGALAALQSFRALAVGGVNPNLVLVAFLFFLFAGLPRVAFSGLLVAFLLYSFVAFPFWGIESVALALVVLLAWLFKSALTGNATFDFFIFLALAVPVFYLLRGAGEGLFAHGLNLSLYTFSFPAGTLGELVYNLLLGGLVWGLLRSPLRNAFKEHSGVLSGREGIL